MPNSKHSILVAVVLIMMSGSILYSSAKDSAALVTPKAEAHYRAINDI